MTQPKPAAGRDPAQEDPPAPQPAQPLPFTPAKSIGQQGGARASVASAFVRRPARRSRSSSPRRVPPRRARKRRRPRRSRLPRETPIIVKPKRRVSRFVMLVVIPLVALALGFSWWLSSGRYVSTDNAYVGADKSLITPQVTGAIIAIHVIEGQKVKVGDPLFDIDPKPYEIALALAKGRVEAAKVEFANLQSSYISNADQIKMGEDAVRRAPDRLRPQERPRHRTAREPRPIATPRWATSSRPSRSSNSCASSRRR